MASTLKYKHCITLAPFSSAFFKFLLALVNDNHKFTVIDIGGCGKSSDGGPFSRSILGKSLGANMLNILNSKPLSNSEELLPFVIVGN
jgi:hypothetical protein